MAAKRMVRKFKVADISKTPIENNLTGYIMISKDGEVWEVGRSPEGQSVPFNKGDIIEVPMVLTSDKSTIGEPDLYVMPDWRPFGVKLCRRKQVANIYEMVSIVWGEEEAERHFSKPPKKSEKSMRKVPVLFKPENFVPSNVFSASQKADLANSLTALLASNCQGKGIWDRSVYIMFCQMYGLGEHKNMTEFAKRYFSTAEARLDLMQIILEHIPAGDPLWGLMDVEKAVRAWCVHKGMIEQYSSTVRRKINLAEQAELKRLLLKWGIPEDFQLPEQ